MVIVGLVILSSFLSFQLDILYHYLQSSYKDVLQSIPKLIFFIGALFPTSAPESKEIANWIARGLQAILMASGSDKHVLVLGL